MEFTLIDNPTMNIQYSWSNFGESAACGKKDCIFSSSQCKDKFWRVQLEVFPLPCRIIAPYCLTRIDPKMDQPLSDLKICGLETIPSNKMGNYGGRRTSLKNGQGWKFTANSTIEKKSWSFRTGRHLAMLYWRRMSSSISFKASTKMKKKEFWGKEAC